MKIQRPLARLGLLLLFTVLPSPAALRADVSIDNCAPGSIVAVEWHIDLTDAQINDSNLLPAGNSVTGSGLPIALAECDVRDLEFDLPRATLDSLLPGRHWLYVRAREQVGDWGELLKCPLDIEPTRVEPDPAVKVFFDADDLSLDPAGAASQSAAVVWGPCSPEEGTSEYLCAELEIDTVALAVGIHHLIVAAKQFSGVYLTPCLTSFAVERELFCPPTLLVDEIFEETLCNDGLDNDGDGKLDAVDPECPDPLSNPMVVFAEGTDPCPPGSLCYESLVDVAAFPRLAGYLELCAYRRDLGGTWIDLSTTGRFNGVVELEPELPTFLTLAPSVREHLLQIEIPVGATLVLTLDDGNPNHAHAILARFGARPTDAVFDRSVDSGEGANARLVITNTTNEAQVLFLLVRGDSFPGDTPYSVTLQADLEVGGLVLESMTPAFGAAGGSCGLSAVIRGAGFESNPTFVLRPSGGGAERGTCSVFIADGSRANVVFDLNGAPLGSYDLVVRALGLEEKTLAGAFRADPSVTGGLVKVFLGGLDAARFNREARLTLSYSNVGDTEIDAPLFLVKAPAGVDLRLERDEDFQGNQLLVLGFGTSGNPGRLASGDINEIPIVFTSGTGAPNDAAFEVQELTATPGNFIGWDTQAAPALFTALEWQETYPELSGILGSTWLELRASLGDLASDLALTGQYPGSARDLFRYAATDRYRGTGFLLGTLRDPSGSPIRGAGLKAFRPGTTTLVGSAFTDQSGRFAFGCLGAGQTYDVRVRNYELLSPASVDIPPTFGPRWPPPKVSISMVGVPQANSVSNGVLPCGSRSGGRPIFPPTRVLSPRANWKVRILRSFDPNDKVGPEGLGATGVEDGVVAVAVQDDLTYTIYFENMTGAAPVQRIEIIDELPGELDLNYLVVREVALGKRLVSLDQLGEDQTSGYVPPPLPRGDGPVFRPHTEIEISPAIEPGFPDPMRPLPVTIDVSVDDVSSPRKIRWVLTAITDLVYEGLLPGDDSAGNGEGHVTFSIRAKPEVASLPGESVDIVNAAVITFDENAPLRVESRIPVRLKAAPRIPRNPLPAAGSEAPGVSGLELGWEAAGADRFDVYLWQCAVPTGDPVRPPDGDPSLIVAEKDYRQRVRRSTADLLVDTAYCWQIVARNVAGTSAGPIWTFRTPPAPPPCPTAPAPVSPANSAREIDPLAPVTFRWTSAPTAEAYSLLLGADGAELAVAAGGFAATEIALGLDLEPGKTYRWQVLALNSNTTCRTGGEPGTGGPIFSFTTSSGTGGDPTFLRGDADSGGGLELTNAVRILGFLFLGGVSPTCFDAADADDNSTLEITDAIRILGYLFLGNVAPPAPGPDNCGPDPSGGGGDLGCEMPCL